MSILNQLAPEERANLMKEVVDSEEFKSHVDVAAAKAATAQREERLATDRYDFGGFDKETGGDYLAKDFQQKGIAGTDTKARKAQKKRILELNDKAEFLSEALQNNGKVSHMPGRRFSFNDLATTADSPLLFPKVTSNIVKEPMEAESNLLSLFQRIEFHNGPQLQTPVMGAAQGRNLEVPEGGEYNELLSEFAGYIVATIAKQGIKVSVTDEVLRYSILDLFNLYLRHAGKAMGRWKETKAARALLDSAKPIFDNNNPGPSLMGRPTSGRNRSGYLNGTFMLQDLFDAFVYGSDLGSVPRVLVMNALAWKIFATDPILRGYIFTQNGSIFQPWSSGNQGTMNPGNGGLTNVFGGTEQYSIAAPNLDTRSSAVPGALGVPFQVMVTPFIPASKKTVEVNGVSSSELVTDILILDPDDVGLYVVDEELMTESFEDVQRDIRSTKLRERYGFAGNNAGNGLFVAKNIVVSRGYDFENGVTWNVDAPTLAAGNPTVPGLSTGRL
jgi:hypothetical protein